MLLRHFTGLLLVRRFPPPIWSKPNLQCVKRQVASKIQLSQVGVLVYILLAQNQIRTC